MELQKCRACGRRLDPADPRLPEPAGRVRFADYRPPTEDLEADPPGTARFCRRHFHAASALQDRSLPDALAALRVRRRGRALSRLGQLVLILLAGVAAWNVAGPIDLREIDQRYGIRVSEGRLRGREIDQQGAVLAARWVATRARPTWNPFRVLWQQLRYNAWTEGYDLVLWIEPRDHDLGPPRYGLYQSGKTLFLRIEFEGRNRVLDASFWPSELEEALEAYGLRSGPAEALP